MFPKNIFQVRNDDMHPYASRGDIVIYEPIELGERIYKGTYIIRYQKEMMIARVQRFIKTDEMWLIFDNDLSKTIKLKKCEQIQVIFFGRVREVLKRLG